MSKNLMEHKMTKSANPVRSESERIVKKTADFRYE